MYNESSEDATDRGHLAALKRQFVEASIDFVRERRPFEALFGGRFVQIRGAVRLGWADRGVVAESIFGLRFGGNERTIGLGGTIDLEPSGGVEIAVEFPGIGVRGRR